LSSLFCFATTAEDFKPSRLVISYSRYSLDLLLPERPQAMTSIHRVTRFAFLLLLLFTISPLQAFGATRHQARKAKSARAGSRQAGPKSGRAERRRAEARRRAETARRAAEARQRAAEDALHERVQTLIMNDDATGEDPEVRRIAVNALGNHAGTVVVMNPKTGRVYSIVNQQWAVHEAFKPCSTIKLVTGLAGLSEGVIDSQDTTTIADGNQVSLTSALAHSKNEYFQTVGGRVGFSKMISYARELGLGEKTGLNVRNESAGRVPQSKTGFAVNHMSSHGDDFKVTALQLATLVSAMSNGGKLLKPFVPATASQTSSTSSKVRRIVVINSEAFKSMLPGMIGSVSYGSGRRAFDPKETIAGKTGTCIENGSWIGLFTSYAPVNDPELAIVVIAKGADGRNHFPAAVAGRIYRDLNSRFAPANEVDSADTRSINSKSPAAILDNQISSDDEEADDSDESSDAPVNATKPGQTIWRAEGKPAESKVKLTTMPITSRTAQTLKPGAQRAHRSASQPK